MSYQRSLCLLSLFLFGVPATSSAQFSGFQEPLEWSVYDGSPNSAYSTVYRGNYSDGSEGSGSHPGADITRLKNGSHVTRDTEVRAIYDGTVQRKCLNSNNGGGGWGNCLVIQHSGIPDSGSPSGKAFSTYAHLSRFAVNPGRQREWAVGDHISKGALIGYVGDTGRASGVHLHFQIDIDYTDYNKQHPFWPNRTDGVADGASEVAVPDADGLVLQHTLSPVAFVETHLGSPGVPPVAGFTMSVGGVTQTDGSTLTAWVLDGQAATATLSSPICGSAQLPVGCSLDPDGNVVSWSWTIPGIGQFEGSAVSTVTLPSLSVGTYSVTLTVIDNQGLQSSPAQGTIVISSALIFNGTSDSHFTNAIFGEPKVDSNGNLWVLSYQPSATAFGSADVKLNELGPGTLLFQSGVITTVTTWSAGLLLTDDRVYVWDRFQVFAFDSYGTALANGWPVYPGDVIATRPAFDPLTGRTFVKTNSSVVAYDRLGGEVARQSYPDAALGASREFPVLHGPGGGLYTIIDNGSGWPYLNRQRLIRYDSALTSACYDPSDGSYGPFLAYGGSIVADQNAVYASFGSQITGFDLNCNATTIFRSAVSPQIVLQGVDSGYLLALQYLASLNQPYDPSSDEFVGISTDGQDTWQRPDLAPDIPLNSLVHAVVNGKAYGIALDKANSNARTLFAVLSASGSPELSLPTVGYCDSCGVAVSGSGAVYLNDLTSTKIYRVR